MLKKAYLVYRTAGWTGLKSAVMLYMGRRLAPRLRKFYHGLPLNQSRKRQGKALFFTLFGWAVSDFPAYRRWKLENQAEVRVLPHNEPELGQFGNADGVSEWQDYHAVRARIDLAEQSRMGALRISPLPMISANSLEREIRRIRLPQACDSPQVSIVIPVYNEVRYTIECLISISENTAANIGYEVLIGDDASTDETRKLLGSVENLKVISHAENLGFLRNCNQVAAQSRGSYILFLNNDVQVTPGWLEALLGAFENDPLVGVAGPKVVYPSGHLQEAGVYLKPDCSAVMIGLNDDPERPQYNFARTVDYCSGACLLIDGTLFRQLGGFDDRYAPAYFEDADLCMRVTESGRKIAYRPAAVVIHHLSKSSDARGSEFKLKCIARNLQKFTERWQPVVDRGSSVRTIAFYLPQFHPIPENDHWWGKGFTEWRNVAKAVPNFAGHYQPRQPADLGHYDLRVAGIMEEQAALARRYGIHGFCFYYYWFAGHRLLEMPVERMLQTGQPKFPYCLCWANENWTRRWDGMDQEILIGQQHSEEDDRAVILDLIRHFRGENYIRVNGRPLLLVYRVGLFPDFARTAAQWREICRKEGVGEIHLAMVESFEMVSSGVSPEQYGCDASVEFPPLGMAEVKPPSGPIVNPEFCGATADYRDLAARFATREQPAYKRFRCVMPGWDNTARRQHSGFCFEHATPGAFQAWMEAAVEQTMRCYSGDERVIFVNAWNEWAEGAYLEPDRRFGHTYLEAIRNGMDAGKFLA